MINYYDILLICISLSSFIYFIFYNVSNNFYTVHHCDLSMSLTRCTPLSLSLFLLSCIRCTYQQKFCFHFISHVPHYCCCCCCCCGCWNGPFSLSGANDAPKTATGDEQLKRTNQNLNPLSKSKSEDSKIKKSFMVRLHHNNNNNSNSKVQLTGPKAGNPGSRQVGEVFRRKHQLQEDL